MENLIDKVLPTFGNPNWVPNWSLCGLELMMEIRSKSTNEVWLSQQPVSKEEYKSIALPEGFSKVAIGRSAHDVAFFRRSPGAAEDGPVDVMKVGDRTFSKVGKPGEMDLKYFQQGFDNFIVLNVYKYHKVMFLAGRTIEILRMEDGMDYVPATTEALGFANNKSLEDRVLPDSWSIREITLQQNLEVEIPYPARVCFFKSGHGFHGPVNLES